MILIRADANEVIGTGHVMRCLSIAKAFALHNISVLFITADEKSKSLISQKGFDSLCMHTEWTELESELEALQEILNRYRPSLLLVDSYYVTERYLHKLTRNVKTAYIDDLNQKRWDVDYLINYNIFSSVFDYSWYKETKTKLILHPKYAPLRDEFKNCPKHEIKSVTDVLVSAGGADPEHITEKILEGICPKLNNVQFHFVVGALNSQVDRIKNMSSQLENATLHINEMNMSDLMKKCDIAVSAAGTTLYELCACGIPTITYTLADNQIVAAEQFEKQGIMLNAGDCRSDVGFICRVKASIEKLIGDIELRRKLSEKMQGLVDGNGAERIVEELI